MVLWILEQFPSTAHIPNNNGDQVVHFAAAEGNIFHGIYNMCFLPT